MYEIASGILKINRDLCYMEVTKFISDPITVFSPIIFPVTTFTVHMGDRDIHVPDFRKPPLYDDLIDKNVSCNVDIVTGGEFEIRGNRVVHFLERSGMSYYHLSVPQMINKLKSSFKYYANVKE